MAKFRTIDGKKIPRVTSILDVISKPALYGFYAKWGQQARGIAKAAAERGTSVHKAIEHMTNGGSEEEARKLLIPTAISYFEGWIDFNKRYSIKIIKRLDDKLVISPLYNYCGECDELCDIYDKIEKVWYKNCLIDYKTGKGIYYTHAPQLAAYWNALKEMGNEVFMGWILQMNEQGIYKFVPLNEKILDRKFKVFLAAKVIFEDQLIKEAK